MKSEGVKDEEKEEELKDNGPEQDEEQVRST